MTRPTLNHASRAHLLERLESIAYWSRVGLPCTTLKLAKARDRLNECLREEREVARLIREDGMHPRWARIVVAGERIAREKK